jgi:hypothetical protein
MGSRRSACSTPLWWSRPRRCTQGSGRDRRCWPTAQGDGAYGDRKSRKRALRAQFRIRAPRRKQRLPTLARVRQSVERCLNFFTQFGRIARRLDRSVARYTAWAELAACVIFIRTGFVP